MGREWSWFFAGLTLAFLVSGEIVPALVAGALWIGNEAERRYPHPATRIVENERVRREEEAAGLPDGRWAA